MLGFKIRGKAKAMFGFLQIMTYFKEYRPCPDYWYKKILDEWMN